jgi:UbiD family decarboxylase
VQSFSRLAKEWIQFLEERGRLLRVNDPADISYDVPRMLEEYDGKKALLFGNVGEYSPSCIFGSSFGTRAQIAESLSVPLEQLLQYYVQAVEQSYPARRNRACRSSGA